MKIKHLFSLLTASGLTVATTFFPQSSTTAQEVKFVCATNQGNYATVVRHPQHGEVPIINWVSDYFSESGYTPQQRCEMVSARFQKYHNQGILNYLTTGRMNRQNVVCVAESENGGCADLLFTLKPGSNPSSTLQRLMNVRAQAGGPLNETGGRIYVNMDDYIENKADSQTSGEVETGSTPAASEENSDNNNVW